MAKSKAAKAGAAAAAVKESQYLRRVIDDEDLRDNIVEAYASLRDAYDRLSDGKHPASALLDDKRLQKDLRRAGESLRDAKHGLQGQRKRPGFGKFILVAIVGAALALALSEDLRKKVLDALFGAEEEFEYTSVTTPSTAPAGGGGAGAADAAGAAGSSGGAAGAADASSS
jgi:hypothetical protein